MAYEIHPIPVILTCFNLYYSAQDLTKSMHNAFLITRMVEKFHIQPRPLDDALSNELLSQILKAADPDKLIFSAGDIKELTAYSNILDNAILYQDTTFLKAIAAAWMRGVKQDDSLRRKG